MPSARAQLATATTESAAFAHGGRAAAHPVGGLSNRSVARMVARSRESAVAPPGGRGRVPSAPANRHARERQALREAVLARATLQRDRASDLEEASTFGGILGILDSDPWGDPGNQNVPAAPPPSGNHTPAGTVIFSNPIRSGQTGDAGGPCGAGHQPCPTPPGPPWPTESPSYQWVIACGMDLSAPGGTEVVSAFDGKLSDVTKEEKLNEHVYGKQVSIRSSNGILGGWYTHLEDVPEKLLGNDKIGTSVAKGERLGTIIDKGPSSHVHFAPGQRVKGTHRCLPELFAKLKSAPPLTDATVTFYADGSAPTIS